MPRGSKKNENRAVYEAFAKWFGVEFRRWKLDRFEKIGSDGDISEFAAWLGISKYDAYRYARGATVPRGANVDAIAARLGDAVYTILEVKPTERSQKIKQILSELDNLSDDEMERIVAIVRESRQRRLANG